MSRVDSKGRAKLHLKGHPGVPIATALMALGFAAGVGGDHWILGGLRGAAIMSVFWIPVVLSAWRVKG